MYCCFSVDHLKLFPIPWCGGGDFSQSIIIPMFQVQVHASSEQSWTEEADWRKWFSRTIWEPGTEFNELERSLDYLPPVQILNHLIKFLGILLWIGDSGFEPAVVSSTTSLQYIKFCPRLELEHTLKTTCKPTPMSEMEVTQLWKDEPWSIQSRSTPCSNPETTSARWEVSPAEDPRPGNPEHPRVSGFKDRRNGIRI